MECWINWMGTIWVPGWFTKWSKFGPVGRHTEKAGNHCLRSHSQFTQGNRGTQNGLRSAPEHAPSPIWSAWVLWQAHRNSSTNETLKIPLRSLEEIPEVSYQYYLFRDWKEKMDGTTFLPIACPELLSPQLKAECRNASFGEARITGGKLKKRDTTLPKETQQCNVQAETQNKPFSQLSLGTSELLALFQPLPCAARGNHFIIVLPFSVEQLKHYVFCHSSHSNASLRR